MNKKRKVVNGNNYFVPAIVISIFVLLLLSVYFSYLNNEIISSGEKFSYDKKDNSLVLLSNDNPSLTPGSGWTGATPQPPTVGSSSVQGNDARVIAHWDMVPFQDVSTTINVGVLAYHFNGIEKVSFSVNNGAWADVTQRTLNPQTGVEEYWVVLDASLFANDGPVEVRAIAYPNNGIPKVLQGTSPINESSSMIFNVNYHNTLPYRITYVSTSGNDNNNCLTLNTPCLTISSAIQKSSSGGSLDGAEIRLGEGTWTLPSVSGLSTINRWFTISSAENANERNVLVYGKNPSNGAGTYLKHLKIRDLRLVYPMYDPSIDSYLWFESLRLEPLGNPVRTGNYNAQTNPSGQCPPEHWYGGYGTPRSSYYTDVTVNNSCHSTYGTTLLRNVFSEYTGWGWGGSRTIINYTVLNIEGSLASTGGFDYHGDIFPFQDGEKIIYGGGNLMGGDIESRGVAEITWPPTVPVDNVAIDRVFLDLGMQWVFGSCDNIHHMIIQDSIFRGSHGWCRESGTSPNLASMNNILIKDTQFYYPGIGQTTGPLWGSQNVPAPTPPVWYQTSTSFDFSVSLNPTSGSVAQGNSVQTTVTATRVSGTASSVTFSASNLPSGVAATFNPTSCTPQSGTPCTSTLTLSANSSAALVSGHSISVTGTSGSTNKNTLYSLTVTGISPPTTPTLTATALSNSSIRLNWVDVTNENNYTLQRNGTGGTFTTIATLNANVIVYTDNYLNASTTYQYRLRANNNAGSSQWSSSSATTYACNNGATKLCSNQAGVCAGSFETCTGGQWPGCNYNSISGYSTGETTDVLCRDNLDNDCDGRLDYYNASVGADNTCYVGIIGINAPSYICSGSDVLLICRSSVSNVGGVLGSINSADCNLLRWNANNEAEFNCPSVTGTNVQARCYLSAQSTPIVGSESRTQMISIDNTATCRDNPILNRINPNLINANETSTIVLSGTGFSPSCGVEINGIHALSPFVTRCVNSTSINFTIPWELAISGEYSLTVIGTYANVLRRSAYINVSVVSYGETCGDLICSASESCDSCPTDCGVCPEYCGNTICEAALGETCSTCSSDCGTCPSSSGSSSSSSSSSSGGPRPGPVNNSTNSTKPQCSDGLDNDGDNLIDYPADLGCSSQSDNIELDSSGLETETGEDEGNEFGGDNKNNIYLTTVFWALLLVIVGVIVLVVVLIYRNLKHKSNITKLINVNKVN